MISKQHQLIFEDLERIYPHVSKLLDDLAGSAVLVTGGVGFLGSWIAELICYLNSVKKMGIKLYLVDRDRERCAKPLAHLLDNDLVEFIRCDTRSISDIPRDVNYLVHAAAIPDNRFHVTSPMETMSIIAEGTASTLRASNRVSNLIKFVNVSSSSVYSVNPQIEYISETSPTLGLNTKSGYAYAEAKRYSEALCAAARNEARVPTINVRPFSFCGAYQSLESPWLLNNFINDALHQRPIRILGDGGTIRSLLYGADLAYWLVVIMLHGKSGQTFNIGSDVGESVLDIAKRVAHCFSPSPSILTNTSLVSASDFSRLVPDISSVRTAFGLEVFTDAALAISRTIDWYRLGLDSIRK